MRHTRGHTNNRRSHHALTETKAVKDATSGALRLPHRLDESTGMYRGKQIAKVKVKGAKTPKVKGPSEKVVAEQVHDHAAEHENAEAKSSKGIMGRITGAGRPKARRGFGGGA